MKHNRIGWLGLALMAACSSTTPYDIEGQVTATTAVPGKIALQFFELDSSGGKPTRTQVLATTLDQIGAFKETVNIAQGNKAVVRAIADTDGNGKCDAGEAWGETEIDNLDPSKPNSVSVALGANPCPSD